MKFAIDFVHDFFSLLEFRRTEKIDSSNFFKTAFQFSPLRFVIGVWIGYGTDLFLERTCSRNQRHVVRRTQCAKGLTNGIVAEARREFLGPEQPGIAALFRDFTPDPLEIFRGVVVFREQIRRI